MLDNFPLNNNNHHPIFRHGVFNQDAAQYNNHKCCLHLETVFVSVLLLILLVLLYFYNLSSNKGNLHKHWTDIYFIGEMLID